MRIQLVRHATLRIDCSRRVILIDPYLAPKHSCPPYAGKSPNPLVDLPFAPERAVEGVDLTIISHLHSDHFDKTARDLLPKTMKVFCQPGSQTELASLGFVDVTPVDNILEWSGVTITRIPGRHGEGKVLWEMGPASGFVLQAPGEPVVYWAGDTIMCEAVREAISRFRPRIVITHSCGAVWGDHVPIVMDAPQTVDVCRMLPEGVVVATHMDSVDHATVSRADLRSYATGQGIGPERLVIPADGETLDFGTPTA
ncbi:MAG: MBL fold metallo-hydrolase [Bacillota bacterium]